MKKVSAILLALFLPLCASAETLQNQLGAPSHIVDTFKSNTEKTVITVDAEVYVPDADRVSVYSVTPRVFSQDELRAMAATCFGSIPYSFDFEEQDKESGTFTYVSAEAQDGSGCYLSGIMWWNPLGVLQDVKVLFERTNPVTGTWYPTEKHTNVYLGNQPAGCLLTGDEAQRMADEAVSKFAPNFSCVGQAIIKGEKTSGSGEYSEDYSGQEAWVLFYGKDLELPVTYDTAFPNDLYNHVHHPETLVVVVDDAGIESLLFHSPYMLNGILVENCTLMSFDKIMEIAAQLMPLKIASYEQSYRDIRVQITEIRLGYMYTLQKDTPGEYVLTPVWDFVGTVEYRQQKNGKITAESSDPYKSRLTINAIDGTVIDRDYGY